MAWSRNLAQLAALLLGLLGCLQGALARASEFQHHRYEDMVRAMFAVQSECSYITRIYSIGRSVEGRHLYVWEFSDNPGIHEAWEVCCQFSRLSDGTHSGLGSLRQRNIPEHISDANACQCTVHLG
ncbi:hypothetical protein CRUP_002732 [Coryphaenoides rupestris]|nr:hypothetical protein CRUP_002732 [Coryphaenoides rupestris]